MKTPITTTGSATYCPEDNKIRLYVGRIPRDEYERLRSEGWTSTPKQSCDFVAVWTPQRRDTALEFLEPGDEIGDEDQSPEDRAADRAERFGGYRDKRLSEATGHADRYDAAPQAHGYQSEKRAERSAARHDRIADRATDRWSKADYWTTRTAGVIRHALYKSTPGVRMGRIKVLEAELRKAQSEIAALWNAQHSKPAAENDWTIHLTLRLAYEHQMLEAQGGRAAHVEMIPGGWLGSRQIEKVNKSSVTGRVVSVVVRGPRCEGYAYQVENPSGKDYSLYKIKTERLAAEVYRPPTEDELAAFTASRNAEKKAAPKKETIPLINPADADAERLQNLWNEQALADREASYKRMHYSLPVTDCKPQIVLRVTQASYSRNSKGTYCAAGTRSVFPGGFECDSYYNAAEKMRAQHGKEVCTVRRTSGEGGTYSASRVIILTDKPQKPLPAAVWKKPLVLETQTA